MENKIYPCFWFNGNASEAANFYCSVFKQTKITDENPMVVMVESSGQKLMFLNGGPEFAINPSISFFVVCETDEDIESSWKQLSENGLVLMALDKYEWSEKYGWVQDRFGISWQLSLGKYEDVGQRISPTLMFSGDQQGKAEQAIDFYTSIFDDSEIAGIVRYRAEDDDVEGTVKHAQFSLGSHVFMAMDSALSHRFGFNEAVSLVVNCETQREIDYYWDRLTQGGVEGRCGWLKDRFGVSWQIVPDILPKLLSNPEKSQRVMEAFMQMNKFDIEQLERA